MKTYEKPEVLIETFEVEDIITASGLGENDTELDEGESFPRRKRRGNPLRRYFLWAEA